MNRERRNLEEMLEIYTIAERREREAYAFYRSAAERVTGDAEKKLLLELAEFEKQHLRLMRSRYDKTLQRIRELKDQGS